MCTMLLPGKEEVVENDKYKFLESLKKGGIADGGLTKGVFYQDKQDKYS